MLFNMKNQFSVLLCVHLLLGLTTAKATFDSFRRVNRIWNVDTEVSELPSNPSCIIALTQLEPLCIEPLLSGQLIVLQEPSIGAFNNAVQQMNLSEVCSPLLEAKNCSSSFLADCANVTNERIQFGMKVIEVVGEALQYICVDEFDVFNRHMACLLNTSGEELPLTGSNPVPQLAVSLQSLCGHLGDHGMIKPPCISGLLQSCVKDVVADQCGNEIATAIAGLADRIFPSNNCTTEPVITESSLH